MKDNKWILILIVLSIIGTAIIYPNLPEQVPAHWNVRGEVDRYEDKPFAFVMAVLPLALYLMMRYLPKIDPKKASYEVHKKPYMIFTLIIVLVFILLHWITMMAALGYDINVGVIVRLLMAILFMVLGNYMGQIRQNYFVGIKTPWTLANEQVWKKTHRVGGYAFFILGLVTALSIFLPGTMAGPIVAFSTIGLVAFVFTYSYFIYRKTVN